MAGSFGKGSRSDKLMVMSLEISFPFVTHGFSLKIDPWNVIAKHPDDGSILFTKEKQIDSCGYEAEDKYAQLEEDYELIDWVFYKDMDLGQVRSTMTAVNGKTMSSKTVIASVIRYHVDRYITLINKQHCTGLRSSDMALVVIIPENLTYGTKSLVFEAALEAGVDRDGLSFVSRPMALLSYYQYLLEEESKLTQTKHMVIIDIQESTTEVHVFEKKADGQFISVAQYIRDTSNVSFRQLMHQWLKDTLGGHVYDKLCRDRRHEMLEFDREMRERIRRLPGSLRDVITLKIPVSFIEVYTDTGQDVKTIRDHSFLAWSSDKLRLRKTFFEKMFKPYIDIVTSMIGQVVQNGDMGGPSTQVYFVGWIFQCQYITEATSEVLRNQMSGVSTIVTKEPNQDAIRGGVFIGHTNPPPPPAIVARYTYGVSTGMLMKTLIKRGQYGNIGPATTKITVPTKDGQAQIVLNVIASSRERPLFGDMATDKRIGSVTIDVPVSATSRKIDVEISMEILGTELTVTAKEQISQKCYVRRYACE